MTSTFSAAQSPPKGCCAMIPDQDQPFVQSKHKSEVPCSPPTHNYRIALIHLEQQVLKVFEESAGDSGQTTQHSLPATVLFLGFIFLVLLFAWHLQRMMFYAE